MSGDGQGAPSTGAALCAGQGGGTHGCPSSAVGTAGVWGGGSGERRVGRSLLPGWDSRKTPSAALWGAWWGRQLQPGGVRWHGSLKSCCHAWVAGQNSPVPKSRWGWWMVAGDAAPGPGCPNPPRHLSGSLGMAPAWPDPALQHDLVYSSFLTRSCHSPFSRCQKARGIWQLQTVSSCCAEGRLAAPRAPSPPCAPGRGRSGTQDKSPGERRGQHGDQQQGSAARVLFGQLLVCLGLTCDAVCWCAWGCVVRVMEPQVCMTRWHLLVAGHWNGECDAHFGEGRFPPVLFPVNVGLDDGFVPRTRSGTHQSRPVLRSLSCR